MRLCRRPGQWVADTCHNGHTRRTGVEVYDRVCQLSVVVRVIDLTTNWPRPCVHSGQPCELPLHPAYNNDDDHDDDTEGQEYQVQLIPTKQQRQNYNYEVFTL